MLDDCINGYICERTEIYGQRKNNTTYLIKKYYVKNAILEEINERSSPTPHGGGIALVYLQIQHYFML